MMKDCKYALVLPTSMGVRLTPADRQPVSTSYQYSMQATSAESNVGNVSASLGLKVKVLTAFVEGSEISAFIRGELRKRNFEFEGPEVPAGGPWGYRHQFNIADSGFGMRGPRVQNDRAGEVGRTLNVNSFDLERLFNREKCQVLHLSGLIAALSPETSEFCVSLARAAQQAGTKVSFDLNYRASFWAGRERDLRKAFTEIAGLSDILIGNEEDFQLALGIEGPEAGGENLSDKIDAFKGMIGRVKKAFPQATTFATTLREVISANQHRWGAILLHDNQWSVVDPRDIPVYDRIGGGDGFVGGMLYGMLQGWPPEQWVQFGWATGAMAATLSTDYAQPVSEEQVWAIYEGNARVKR